MSSAGPTAGLPVMEATEAYEAWLRNRLDVVEADLQYKHQQMAASLFAFLRGAFYRWAALWEETLPDLARAPRLLAVGDLHVQNFGTWRDLEGRLVWGVNDLDEVRDNALRRRSRPHGNKCYHRQTREGPDYRRGRHGRRHARRLFPIARSRRQTFRARGEPSGFARHGHGRGARPGSVLVKARQASGRKSAEAHQAAARGRASRRRCHVQFVARIAGMGSLGRPRYVAIGTSNGGLAAREAKAWLPSAWGWAMGKVKDRAYALRLIERAARQHDP